MSHNPFPDRFAFILNNPIRRYLYPPEDVVSKLHVSSIDVVVDFGCGPGFLTIPLAKVARRAIVVDVSPHMLRKAASCAKKNRLVVELLQSDGTEIKIADASVDLILLGHVFHEVEDRRRVLNEFFRIMKPSGRLAIIEKTRGGRIFPGKLGPPIVRVEEIVREIEQATFKPIETIHLGKDTIVISGKM